MKKNSKIILIIVIAIVILGVGVFSIANMSSNNKAEINPKYKECSESLVKITKSELVAMVKASYPSESTKDTIYCKNPMLFLQDFAKRSRIELKQINDKYVLDIPANNGSNNLINIFVPIYEYEGSGFGSGPKIDDEKAIIKSDGNYNLCSTTNLGCAFAFALAKDSSFKHCCIHIEFTQDNLITNDDYIECFALDKVNKVYCSQNKNWDDVNKVVHDAIGLDAQREELKKPSNNIFVAFGTDVDSMDSPSETIHLDSIQSSIAVLCSFFDSK